MIKINKTAEPDALIRYKKKHPSGVYDDLDNSEDGRELRREIRQSLLDDQHGICCYCCKQIELEKSSVEHIVPRDLRSDLSMDYRNLLVSCRSQDTCSSSKKNRYDASRFISPLDERCEDAFAYASNGEIVGTTDSAEYTIELLNLNSAALKRRREACMKICEDYKNQPEFVKELISDSEGKFNEFANVYKYFIKNNYRSEGHES